MKKIRIIAFTGLVAGILNFTASSQTLSSVMSETISFLQNKTIVANQIRSAVIEFSFVDNLNDFGIISGRAVLVVDSSFQTLVGSPKGLKKYFLKSAIGPWISTNGTATSKTFTFTSPSLLTAPATLTITSSRGTGNNSVRYDMPALKTNNSTSNGANEYIISGFIDSSNPRKYVTIRIIMQFIQFG